MGDPTFAGTLDPVALISGGADSARSWARTRWPAGRWGRAARSAICELLDVVIDGLGGLPADIVERVDAAYPFGARPPAGPSFPYKAWLAERKAFITAITPPVVQSADEIAACEIARDAMAEIEAYRILPTTSPLSPALGTVEQVVAMLDREAPNRLARKCPACGSRPGAACREIELEGERLAESAALLVPHHARLVGHLDAGPLFTARAT